MNKTPKTRLTLRGKIVLGLIVLVLAYLVATRLWFTGGGWCIGTLNECLIP
jgi:hypothetical protein